MYFLGLSMWTHTPNEHRAATKDTLSVFYAGHDATYRLRQCAREALADGGTIDRQRLHMMIERRSKSRCTGMVLEIMDAIALADFKDVYGG